MLRELIARLFKRRRPVVEPEPPHRVKGQHVSWLTFKEVKHSLKLVGKARGYETVKKVADMHHIGRTTAYLIKKAASYADFKGTAKKVEVVSKDRTTRVKVHNR